MLTESADLQQQLTNFIASTNLQVERLRKHTEQNLSTALDQLLDPDLNPELDLKDLQDRIGARILRAHNDRRDESDDF
jgi:hypothetical protein